MPRFNPDFWEVLTDPEILDQLPSDRHLWHRVEDLTEADERFHRKRRALLAAIHEIIDTSLTEKQRRCVLLYFYHKQTQREIAGTLGISRLVVAQHLFGVRRDGKRVSGAIKKIRQICRRRGLEP